MVASRGGFCTGKVYRCCYIVYAVKDSFIPVNSGKGTTRPATDYSLPLASPYRFKTDVQGCGRGPVVKHLNPGTI